MDFPMANEMSNTMSNDEWLSVDKVADELKLKPVTVKRYAREGLLNGKQVNKEWRFLSSDIEKFKEIQAKL
jgi:predicted site-specific integrase-resolvase